MKSRLHLLATLLLAPVLAVCDVVVPCRVRRPDAAALSQRMALLQESHAPSPVRAAMRADVRQAEVDVLVAYDLSAQRWLSNNGKGTPSAYAQRKVDEMNACLANSRIDEFRFRLVGTVSISEDASQRLDYWGYVDMDAVLASLVNDEGRVVARGEWARITDARETLGADVVSVLVDAGLYGNVGMGYSLEDGWGTNFSQTPSRILAFGDWAYSVCSIAVADEDHSMLHEIGHNMGCGHPDGSCASYYAMELGPQLFSYSSGYYTWIGGEGYYTIMGYNFGGLRVDKSFDFNDRFTELPYFSSPLLTYYGVPLGTAANDNRRTLLQTYSYVAQYRAAKLASGADPVTSDAGLPTRVFQTQFNPAKAYNGVAPYVGAAYSADTPAAIVRLRCAKAATRGLHAGTSRVSAVVTGLDGKQKRSSSAYVVCDYDAMTSLTVNGWGTLSLTLGGEGFVGSLGSGLTVRTASAGGDWPHARAVVDVDFVSGTALPSGTLTDLLPTGSRAESFTLANGRWNFAPAAAVKYAKTGETYGLQGLSDPRKTNLSAMRLTYDSRKGTFRGSFKVYVLETAGTRPRLLKHTARVTGIVVGGLGFGRAEIRNVGTFPVSIRAAQ